MVYYSLVVPFLQQSNAEPTSSPLLPTRSPAPTGKSQVLPTFAGPWHTIIPCGQPRAAHPYPGWLSLSIPTPSSQGPLSARVEHRFWWEGSTREPPWNMGHLDPIMPCNKVPPVARFMSHPLCSCWESCLPVLRVSSEGGDVSSDFYVNMTLPSLRTCGKLSFEGPGSLYEPTLLSPDALSVLPKLSLSL